MRPGCASKTAQFAAVRRAAHQFFDIPHVFDDPLALRILAPDDAAAFATECFAAYLPHFRYARAYIAARSRYAEDRVAQAVAAGTGQYVILGAGLDTFAYRNRGLDLRIFEVDHPDTQAWKLRHLASAGIRPPPNLKFVPIDFERQQLDFELPKAGLRRDAPTFFSCIGVTPYLTCAAALGMLKAVRGLGPANAIVFDYASPRAALPDWEKTAFDLLSEDVERVGEPFRGFFERDALAEELRGIGFRAVDSPTTEDLNALHFRDRFDGLAVVGHLGGVMCAS
ncbi:MAG: class I SAM-dependent methyltransferase [Hyphomicrobiales bacterium]|nr:class I SAM-dependent methyltransferase [Hyphomicrobiales bacterium]MBV8661980.1 class I SAM-dependent methyltransferase [Hyphomicrobiales bacterium]